MHLNLSQWLIAGSAALLVGISKTGIPGVGILVVPILARSFGGRPSIGIMLPMLIMGDVFAVAWYRRHAQWDKLVHLLPWVVAGMGIGAFALWEFGRVSTSRDILDIVIGCLILVMLAVHLLQVLCKGRLTPKSSLGTAGTGVSAGFATTVSNAAGPIMQIYLTAHRLPKQEFMGTIAWYFFIINVAKMPVYLLLTAINPERPIVTGSSLIFNLELFPAILVGVLIGKWLLSRMSQRTFDTVILILAGVAAVRLVMS